MAKRETKVWGIDIGQTGIKGICLARSEEGPVVEDIETIDFMGTTYLQGSRDFHLSLDYMAGLASSRNEYLRGCRVVGGISTKDGMFRIMKIPPVTPDRLEDIARYEARQNIPFDLEDVAWDWSVSLASERDQSQAELFSSGEDEIYLLAAKRTCVDPIVKLFRDSGVRLSGLQLDSVALANVLRNFTELTGPEYDAILNIGAGHSDIVIANKDAFWCRSIPLGGNHFTRKLSQELHLTLARAEYVKCNRQDEQDIQGYLQIVAHDLGEEIDRSIQYATQSWRRGSYVRNLYICGGGSLLEEAAKAPMFPVERCFCTSDVDGFFGNRGIASEINLPRTHVIAYGLALEGMGLGLKTNLMPKMPSKSFGSFFGSFFKKISRMVPRIHVEWPR